MMFVVLLGCFLAAHLFMLCFFFFVVGWWRGMMVMVSSWWWVDELHRSCGVFVFVVKAATQAEYNKNYNGILDGILIIQFEMK